MKTQHVLILILALGLLLAALVSEHSEVPELAGTLIGVGVASLLVRRRSELIGEHFVVWVGSKVGLQAQARNLVQIITYVAIAFGAVLVFVGGVGQLKGIALIAFPLLIIFSFRERRQPATA